MCYAFFLVSLQTFLKLLIHPIHLKLERQKVLSYHLPTHRYPDEKGKRRKQGMGMDSDVLYLALKTYV